MGSASLRDVLGALVPYLDQQSVLSLRLSCSAAAAVCAPAVQELTYVLGSIRAAAGVSSGFTAALKAFSGCSSLRVFCMLRRGVHSEEAAALFAALQQRRQLPLFHSLLLSEVKGQGALHLHHPAASVRGVGAVLTYLPMLDSQLQSLDIKCLRPPASTNSVLPRLLQLSVLCLDGVLQGFSPMVLQAVGQLHQLRQLTVCVDLSEHGEPERWWFTTTGRLEHLAPLSLLSRLQFRRADGSLLASQSSDLLYLVIPSQLTALRNLRHLTFAGPETVVQIGSVTHLACQLHSLHFIDSARYVLPPRPTEPSDDGDYDDQQPGPHLPQPQQWLQEQLQKIDKDWEGVVLQHLSGLTSLQGAVNEAGVVDSTGGFDDSPVYIAAAAMAAPAAVAAALAALAPPNDVNYERLTQQDYQAAAEAAAAEAQHPLTLGSAAAAAAAQAAAAALASVVPQHWPVPLSTVYRMYVTYMIVVVKLLHVWSKPAHTPRLQRLRSLSAQPLGTFDPHVLTSLTLLCCCGQGLSRPSCLAVRCLMVTNLQELALPHGVTVDNLQQWLPHLPMLQKLDVGLQLHPKDVCTAFYTWPDQATLRQRLANFRYPTSLVFPRAFQGLASIRLAVIPKTFEELARCRSYSCPLPQPPPLMLLDLPWHSLTHLSLSNWVFRFGSSGAAAASAPGSDSEGQPLSAEADLIADGTGECVHQPGADPRLPPELHRLTLRGVPSDVAATDRPWADPIPLEPATCSGDPCSSVSSGSTASSSQGHLSRSDVSGTDDSDCYETDDYTGRSVHGYPHMDDRLRFDLCLLQPPELCLLQASSSTLEVLELFEVPLTDMLLSSVAASCPHLTTLVIDCRETEFIECSLSATGLQPLSQLQHLRTLLLLPHLEPNHYLHTWYLMRDVLKALAASNAERVIPTMLADQHSAQPWRKLVWEQEQQQLLQDHALPWCVDGSALSAALSSLQCLHHLKVGLPIMPAESVLQLSALTSLQLLDIGAQQFNYYQHGWGAVTGADPPPEDWDCRWQQQQLMVQLDGLLPAQCRLLHMEGDMDKKP